MPSRLRSGWIVTPDSCCDGIAGVWPVTGPTRRRARGGRQLRRPSGSWSSRWQPRTRRGATGGSTVNSSRSATASAHRRSGRSSRTTHRLVRQWSTVTWSTFLHSQAAVAYDFACVDTVTLRRYHLLFFIDIPTRRVFYAPGPPRTPPARNLLLRHGQSLERCESLVRDRGSSPPRSTRCSVGGTPSEPVAHATVTYAIPSAPG